MRHVFTWRFAKRLAELTRQRGLGVLTAGTPPGGHEVAGYVYDPEASWNDVPEFLRIEREALAVFARAHREQVTAWIDEAVRTASALETAVRDAGSRLVVVRDPGRGAGRCRGSPRGSGVGAETRRTRTTSTGPRPS